VKVANLSDYSQSELACQEKMTICKGNGCFQQLTNKLTPMAAKSLFAI
jgi:hypothetical protein